MNYIGKFFNNFKDFYSEINSATLTGAIDVIVVQQKNGTYLCSPFHVRFGKLGVLRSREKLVDIEVNGEPIDIHMKLGESGEAFFVEEVYQDDIIPSHLATSPIPDYDMGQLIEQHKKDQEKLHNESPNSTYTPTIIKAGDCPRPSSVSQSFSNVSQSFSNDSLIEDNQYSILQHSEEVVEFTLDTDQPLNLSKSDENPNRRLESSLSSSKERTSSQNSNVEVPNFISLSKSFHEVSIGVQTDDDSTEVPQRCASKASDSELVVEAKKRKRRKRSTPRRWQGPELSSATTKQFPIPNAFLKNAMEENPGSEPEEIFKMDDDYQDKSSALSRSVSLPIERRRESLPIVMARRQYASTFSSELHPFSDGDLTPICSPIGSRPATPKSDTEFEFQKLDATSQTEGDEVSWSWGELPNVSKSEEGSLRKTRSNTISQTSVSGEEKHRHSNTQTADHSVITGMLDFMRTTKKLRHMPENEGIYLADLNPDDLDPEVAALYFPKFRSAYELPNNRSSNVKDDDVESGNGPSLPHSPHSMDGVISGLDSDSDEHHSLFEYCSKSYSDIGMSLCGGLQEFEGQIPTERFLLSYVTFDDFCENPSLLQNPDLVVRMGGKYYNWQVAAPMIMSLIMFHRPLPEKNISRLINEFMPKKKKKTYSWWSWRRTESNNELKKDDQSSSVPTSPTTESMIPIKEQKEMSQHLENSTSPSKSHKIEFSSTEVQTPIDQEITISIPETNENGQITPDRKSKHSSDSPGIFSGPENHLDAFNMEPSFEPIKREVVNYRKSLRLTSDQIKCLGLRHGANEVVFSVTTAYQGTTTCKCNVYLWRYDDKIVISDIDGTITKSDVLGHILPFVGIDWAQSGLAKLFTKIHGNGYNFLYLSARAIGQARITRDYLKSIRQGDLCLPDGPLLLSPTSLFNALHREVIEKKPEEFKISCLTDIRALFPEEVGSPFYAGFGNKINDTWAYRAVGIPVSRIFTINHRGELKLDLIQTFQSSYTRLSDVVDHVFPPLGGNEENPRSLLAPPEEYSSFTYWRVPIPTLSAEEKPAEEPKIPEEPAAPK